MLAQKGNKQNREKRRDDVENQSIKVGQNKVPKWANYSCRKHAANGARVSVMSSFENISALLQQSCTQSSYLPKAKKAC
ncbi:MAG: hypothetical protein ACYTBS_16865, partial [Planctomycetota bacterium]